MRKVSVEVRGREDYFLLHESLNLPFFKELDATAFAAQLVRKHLEVRLEVLTLESLYRLVQADRLLNQLQRTARVRV